MSSALLEQAKAASAAGSWDQAIETYKRALESTPDDVEVCRGLANAQAIRGQMLLHAETLLRLVRLLMDAQEYQAACEAAQSVTCIRPDGLEAHEAILTAYHRLGDQENFLKKTSEFVKLCLEYSDEDRAITALNHAISEHPDRHNLKLDLAEAYITQGNLREGARIIQDIAEVFTAEGTWEHAAKAYKRLKVIQPQDIAIPLTLGHLYAEEGLSTEAEQEYRAVLKLDLQNTEALLGLARLSLNRGASRDATLAFNRVLEISPNNAVAREGLAEVHHSQGITEEAIKNYLAAGEIYLKTNRRGTAIRMYQFVLGLNQFHPLATQLLTQLGAPVTGLKNPALDPKAPPVLRKVEVPEDPEDEEEW